MQRLANYIDGKFAPPVSGKYIENFNPAIGGVYSLTPDSDERDIDLAVQATSRAFPEWPELSVQARASYLCRIAELIGKNLEKLAEAESVDNGQPVALARTIEIPRAASNFHFFATAIEQFASEAHAMGRQAINYTLRDLRTPFGGMKNSGLGREGGFEALRFFTEPKNVCV